MYFPLLNNRLVYLDTAIFSFVLASILCKSFFSELWLKMSVKARNTTKKAASIIALFPAFEPAVPLIASLKSCVEYVIGRILLITLKKPDCVSIGKVPAQEVS